MSYIQIEIGGKLRGLKFNQMAVVILAQKADYQNFAATGNYAMIYGGLKANCYVKSEEPDFTFEEVCDWVDSLSQETLTAIDNCLQEAESYKRLLEKGQKETVIDKKKLKPIKLKASK